MLESSKEFRAKFPRAGMQTRFITCLRKHYSATKLAEVCKCSCRTIRDWQREKFIIDYAALILLCTFASLPIPRVKKVPRYAHTIEAGRKGAAIVMKKYGHMPINNVSRLAGWRKWWDASGHINTIITKSRDIRHPHRSTDLAEFVGIIMGDGGIADYQVIVTLHSIDDKEYGEYVAGLITKLFSTPVSIQPRINCNATDYVVSRKQLVSFCIQTLGLVQGNKVAQQITIPQWVIQKPNYTKACIRGLFDTDGSVFTHTYSVKGKIYRYKKMSFCSRSIPLLHAVCTALESLGIRARIGKDQVWLDSRESVQKYMEHIGTHNPKHLKRWRR